MKLGDRSRCLQCGGKIVLVDDWRVISLDQAVWVHKGSIRRAFSNHPAVGPTS